MATEPSHSLNAVDAARDITPKRVPTQSGQRLTPGSSPSRVLTRDNTRDPAPDPSLNQDPNFIRILSTQQSMSAVSEDPELPSEARPPSPPPREGEAPPPVEEVTLSRLGAHYSGLVLASMAGCLIRLGLTALGTYDGHSVYPLLWAQGVGCGVMGFALDRKSEIAKIYPPIYTFLTTGVAGSITTFSSWMLESFLSFSNQDDFNRGGLYDTVDGLAYSFSTWLVALAAVDVGLHFSSIFPPLPTRLQGRRVVAELRAVKVEADGVTEPPQEIGEAGRPTLGDTSTSSSSATATSRGARLSTRGTPSTRTTPSPRTRNPLTGATPVLDTLFISSAFASYLIALLLYFLGPRHWRHEAIFPMLLSPPGAILRFALARINPKQPFIDRFPLGTFIANMLATLVVCSTYVGMRPVSVGSTSTVRCNALYGLEEGFCGCLSTVSTFVVEARAIKKKRWKWIYVGGSVVLGHLFALAIVGGTRWTRGFGSVCA
ncbi:CrcB-like protein-domain-containing protein [Kockovaella imperatae]|uniref:CrcB-like protein-domain-containing protein n=1 Tax=Kockovaella imperatae TaxID=4999 RepID=A0A1Y1U7L2_9TREE|nr:CrcB-like protein-domain-containing protein [Kockovaella imperatae]ORX34021.1 CrcB-like protein-domain-containing protein [Kockovaella imperatae]